MTFKFEILCAVGMFFAGCSSPSPPVANTPVPTPTPAPIRAIIEGLYAVPSCDSYDKIPEQRRILFNTAQEAELSGYHPIEHCKIQAEAYIKVEKMQVGTLSPSAETERRREELMRFKELRNQADEIKENQRRLELKQREIEDDRSLHDL
jgi:hypothetical protein